MSSESVEVVVAARLDDRDQIYVLLPRHISLHIEHNPHASNYESIETWLANRDTEQSIDITPSDREAILQTKEVWVMSWCPDTPVGSCSIAAATLERLLQLVDPAWPK